jgi:crotonobetainyl-CoA:carnitine CoA-transferase CaiB-like acyl-CoA transferase
VKLFEGVRVLDLSRMLAGPYGSMLLADMGAEVLKIEERTGGDPMRAMGPPFLPDGESAYFLAINRNKKSLALDLTRPAGRDVFLDLVAQADVVWENFRPGVMDRLGLGYSALSGVNPRLVMCSLSAYGQDGPYRDWPAFDLALQAMGGAMSITGEPGGQPVRMGLPMGDLAGGLFGALSVAGALLRRTRTGRGAHVDLSLLDCQVSLLSYLAQYFWTDGVAPQPMGSAHTSVVPYGTLATRDGHLIVAVFERFWPAFCRAIGHSEWTSDARFATNGDRVANRAALMTLIERTFAQRTTAEWLERLHAESVPSAPIQTVDRVLDDPQVRHREMVVALQHERLGTLPTLGTPIKVDGATGFTPAPPPRLGQHTDEVLATLLKYPGERIDALRREGAIA